MKLCVSPTSLKNAYDLINHGADYLIVGQQDYSIRQNFYLNNEELIALVNQRKTTKIIVAVNAFFYDNQLTDLTNYLHFLKTLDIDCVMFSDYAVAEINLSDQLSLNLMYNSETTVTSSKQFPFFVENGIQSVFLAREMWLAEVRMICHDNPLNVRTMIQINGLLFVMHSRWNLVSNFAAYARQYENVTFDQDAFLEIQEQLRRYPHILKQDESGTHMYSGYEICCVDILDKIQSTGVNLVWINNYQHTDEQSLEIFMWYQQAVNHLLNNTYDDEFKKQAWESIKQISHNQTITHNFYGIIKDILSMEKNEDEK
ncbi:U32 family peptidase [Ureaplasma miroungigenitalium]|uniref:U32 family peptidase n=1 Tax=Ureaplasma miroungigenitalium TaxID=1042321 RepID=A0ABT3BNN5_9BACT|nr:U32 family peptidase [Ureaplasma miroungigenitalium]MCV3728706.1 U32 family peptidase [Ureaplasma miroungigenitalium]MCV3734470.1 U32 family peptidase [Ureaplasma miroungigenitalium]